MYIKKLFSVLGLLFITLLMSSLACKKYLDKKPDSNLTVPQSLDDLNGLFNDAQLMNFQLTPSMGESSADDYFLRQATYDYLTTQAAETYRWSLKEYKFANDWSAAYLPVYNANFTLESLAKIPRTLLNKDHWDRLKGYALFVRAYNFLNLAWNHAKAYDSNTAANDPGVVLRTTANFNIRSSRASVKATYQQIILDAKESTQLLPDFESHVLIPSKAAAYGLLARTFLSMAQYDSAFKYSNLCLNLKSDLLDYNQVDISANIPFTNFKNPEVLYYTEMNLYNGNHYSYRGFVDTLLYGMYDDMDLRKYAYFKMENGYPRFKGAYTANSIYLFSGIATDEMFLIRAECGARLGNLESALEDLNILMKKRWNNSVPFTEITSLDQTDVINKILTERRKELLMRGLRWADIKRLNKQGDNITPVRIINGVRYTLPPNDHRYALPIPVDIISSSGISQN